MEKLLIVDDEASLLSALVAALEDDFEIKVAQSVEEALHLVKDFSPDVLLTDYKMPGQNGLTLLQALTHHSRPIRKYLFSACLSDEEKRRVMALGVRLCIAKPFNVKDLRRLLQEKPEAQ